MDKYEYKLKSEQIKRLYEEKDYKTAAAVAEEIDWTKVKNMVLINAVADIYEETGQLEKARDLLFLAYERTEFGRQLAYRLCLLSLKLQKYSNAIDFYNDYVKLAPKDPGRYLLKYHIAKAKNADISEQIVPLESYLMEDIDDEWQYELAKLQVKAGNIDRAVSLCDEITLWFNGSEYVKKALELKKDYAPLTANQEQVFEEYINPKAKDPEVKPQEKIRENIEYNNDDINKIKEYDILEETFNEEEIPKETFDEIELPVEEEIFADSDMQEIKAPEPDLEITEEETPELESEESAEEVVEVITEPELEEMESEEMSEDDSDTRVEMIDEKTRMIKEEIEQQNGFELNGPFSAIIRAEVEEAMDTESEEDESSRYFDEEYEEEILDEHNDDDDCEYGLTPELQKVFERYLPVNGMEAQLADVLENLVNEYVEDGTSSKNNIVIAGDEKTGKTSLIIDIIKVVNKERERTGRRIAKIKGESLNRKGMKETMPKLFGSDLIIEHAGNLNPETLQELVNAMKEYTNDMIVIFEDNDVALERLFKVNPQLKEMFENEIKIKEVGVKEWVEIAKEYARECGYIVDEMGTLSLHVKIGNVYSRELNIDNEQIKDIVEEAIEKSKKKKRFAKKNKTNEGFSVLREADFM